MEFAIKVSKKTEASRQSVIEEAKVIKALNSEHIVSCKEVFDSDGCINAVLEKMDGNFCEFMAPVHIQRYPESFCKYTLYMTAKALQAMHSRNVLHRDIKADNILWRANGDIKIADLGVSVFLTQKQMFRNTVKGTTHWLSPEIARGVYYSKEVDVWAYGCFAFELATGEPPFVDLKNNRTVLSAIIN